MHRSNPKVNDDRARLAAWLCEWETDRRLQPAETDAAAFAALRAYPGQKRARPISVGVIRLLAPDTPATAARPVYVAVIAQVGLERWQVAPFGRFATPALPGELALRRQAIHLQVLCLWNTAVLSVARLRTAYPVGRLTAAERNDVAAVRAGPVGAPLQVGLARRVGPPLIHPLDPRQLYIEEERAIWLEPVPASVADSASPELLMAAETRARY
jgi:hypothetical protein